MKNMNGVIQIQTHQTIQYLVKKSSFQTDRQTLQQNHILPKLKAIWNKSTLDIFYYLYFSNIVWCII